MSDLNVKPAIHEEVDLRHSRVLSNLEFMRARFLHYEFPKHFHESYVIEVVEEGIDSCFCRGATHRAEAGDIILINPYEVHTGNPASSSPLIYRSFYPSIAMMSNIAEGLGRNSTDIPFFSRTVISDPWLANLMRSAHASLSNDPEGLEAQEMLIKMFSRLVIRHSHMNISPASNASDMRGINKTREYLHENFDRQITLSELSAISGVSEFHLLRTFKKATGLTPHEYLTSIRIERSKRLLASSQPIAQVALETGFYDQSHFARHFKRVIGVTPGRFLSQ